MQIAVTLTAKPSRLMPLVLRAAVLWLALRPHDADRVAGLIVRRFIKVEIPDGVAVQ